MVKHHGYSINYRTNDDLLMGLSEQHLKVYEALIHKVEYIEALDILSARHYFYP